MERCETKKGQSIWRKFDVENVRMSWKVWDMRYGKPGLFKEWAPVFLSVLIANQVSIHSITNDYSDPIRSGR